MFVVALIFGCSSTPMSGVVVAKDGVHIDGRSCDGEHEVLDGILVDGAMKKRRFDAIMVAPDAQTQAVVRMLDLMFYAGKQAPVEVKGEGLFQPYHELNEGRCELLIVLAKNDETMWLNLSDTPNGYRAIKSVAALAAMTGPLPICGIPDKTVPTRCSRALLIGDHNQPWEQVAKVHQAIKETSKDWALMSLDLKEIRCTTP